MSNLVSIGGGELTLDGLAHDLLIKKNGSGKLGIVASRFSGTRNFDPDYNSSSRTAGPVIIDLMYTLTSTDNPINYQTIVNWSMDNSTIGYFCRMKMKQGTYIFAGTIDDWAAIYINDVLVFTNNGQWGTRYTTTWTCPKNGLYNLRVYQGNGVGGTEGTESGGLKFSMDGGTTWQKFGNVNRQKLFYLPKNYK